MIRASVTGGWAWELQIGRLWNSQEARCQSKDKILRVKNMVSERGMGEDRVQRKKPPSENRLPVTTLQQQWKPGNETAGRDPAEGNDCQGWSPPYAMRAWDGRLWETHSTTMLRDVYLFLTCPSLTNQWGVSVSASWVPDVRNQLLTQLHLTAMRILINMY